MSIQGVLAFGICGVAGGVRAIDSERDMSILGSCYLGRSNHRRHLGVCDQCGYAGELIDYQTRRWHALLMLPILPTTQKQMVVRCPECNARYAAASGEGLRGRGLRPSELARPSCNPPFRRRSARWALGLVAALIACVCVSMYMRSHRPVHVANGLPTTVTVAIDGGEPLSVAPGSVEVLRVAEGSREAVIVDSAGRTQRCSFLVEGNSLFGRFGDDRVYVLNPFGAAVVVREKTAYSLVRSSGYMGENDSVYLGEPFLCFNDVDHLFEPLPDVIEVDNGSNVTYRTGVNILTQAESGITPAQMLLRLVGDEDVSVDQLMTYAEAHLSVRPSDLLLLTAYRSVAISQGRARRCQDHLVGGLDVTPARLDWHRVHCDLAERAGDGEAVAARYRAELAADPDNPDLRYLAGITWAGAAETLRHMAGVLKVAPGHRHAMLGRGWALLATGRFPEAAEATRAALAGPDVDAYRREALMAAGRYADLAGQYRRMLKDDPLDLQWHLGLLEVLVAAGDLDAARREQDDYGRVVAAETDEDPEQLVLQSRLALMVFAGDAGGVLRSVADLQIAAPCDEFRFGALLELGDTDQAGELESVAADWEKTLCVSIAQHIEHEDAEAALWRKKGAGLLAQGNRRERTCAALLAAGPDADPAAARDINLPPRQKAPLLLAMVQAGADPSLLVIAEKLNFGRTFPYHLLTRGIKQAQQAQQGR